VTACLESLEAAPGVESEKQIMETAEGVAAGGARMLRGGAFKPRTSPYDFQGLEVEGLRLLRKVTRSPLRRATVTASTVIHRQEIGVDCCGHGGWVTSSWGWAVCRSRWRGSAGDS